MLIYWPAEALASRAVTRGLPRRFAVVDWGGVELVNKDRVLPVSRVAGGGIFSQFACCIDSVDWITVHETWLLEDAGLTGDGVCTYVSLR